MKRFMYSLVTAVLLVGALSACGGQQGTTGTDQTAKSQGTITIKLADSFPNGHTMNETSKFFIKRVDELSKGKLKVEYYPSEQLGKLKDMLQLVSNGTADVTVIIPSFFTGQLPLNTVTVLPYWSTATEGMEIYKRLLQTAPELNQEFAKYGTKALFVASTSQYDVGTVKKPVHSPEDLRGLKLKSSGGMFDKIAAKYGVNTVTIPANEMYEATEKGILDGNIMSFTSVKGYRINELEKYHTFGLRLGGAPVVYTMNEKSWQKLPEDLQKIMLQAGEETGLFSADLWDKGDKALVEQFQKAGMSIYTIKPEERAKWEAPLKGIEQDWINDMNQKGLPGQKVFDEYDKISKEVVK